MNEAEQIFNQTSAQRKRTSYGAYHKKGGSRSKRCTLPSDYLSKAQKEALNGELATFQLGKPMDWYTFKSMPEDLKYDYLKALMEKHEGRDKDVAEMFGISQKTLSTYKSNHFSTLKRGRGGDTRKPVSPKWLAFINAEAETSDEDLPKPQTLGEVVTQTLEAVTQLPMDEDDEEQPVIPQPISAPPMPLGITRGNFCFTGSKDALLQYIERILEDGVAYKVYFDFTQEVDSDD